MCVMKTLAFIIAVAVTALSVPLPHCTVMTCGMEREDTCCSMHVEYFGDALKCCTGGACEVHEPGAVLKPIYVGTPVVVSLSSHHTFTPRTAPTPSDSPVSEPLPRLSRPTTVLLI
jgi:hypothetical protein